MNEELEEVYHNCEHCHELYEEQDSDAYFYTDTYCSIECEKAEMEEEK